MVTVQTFFQNHPQNQTTVALKKDRLLVRTSMTKLLNFTLNWDIYNYVLQFEKITH